MDGGKSALVIFLRFSLGFFLTFSSHLMGPVCAENPKKAEAARPIQSLEKRHGIAMHGDLKYPAGFAAFDYVNPEAPKGGKITFSVVGTYNSLNPFVLKGTPPAGLSLYSEPLVYERLMRRSADEPFSLYSGIAETVEMPEDRSFITFHLNPQARWADGKPITADDVIFTHHLLKEKGVPNIQLYYGKVARVEKTGDRSVRFFFKPLPQGGYDPEAPFLIALMVVLPQHALSGKDFEKMALEPIMGSGPYRIDRVDPGHRIVYKRRPDYWGKDLSVNRGTFNFDEVHFEYYRNIKAELEAFKVGLCDVRTEQNPVKWGHDVGLLPQETVGKGGHRLRVLSYTHQRPVGMRGFIFNLRRQDLFGDRRVREALVHVFDFNQVNKTLFHSLYQRTKSYFANTFLASRGIPQKGELSLLTPYKDTLPADLFVKPFDLPKGGSRDQQRAHFKKALGLLQEAGWKVHQGKLVHKDTGKPFAFEILLYNAEDEKTALAFVRDLKKVGISPRIRLVDPAQYETRVSHYDYDMIIGFWGHTFSPGNEQKFYWGSEEATKPGGRNLCGIQEKLVDALCEKVAQARDRATLVDAIHSLDRVLLWGHYVIPLFHTSKIYLAYWDKFGHPDIRPEVGIYFSFWWSREEEKT